MYKKVQYANTLLLKSPSPNTYYFHSFIEELHSYQDTKEMDIENPSYIFSFLFQQIKEEIRSHPQVEIMRWLIN